MATIKELLNAMIDKINGNEDKIDNIKGVPEAFDSITMTNGTDTANLTMSAEKELLFNGEPVGSSSGGGLVRIDITEDDEGLLIASKTYDEISDIILSGALPYCVYYNSVFQLYHSDVIDEMSTYRELPSHKFSSLAVEGTINSYMRSIHIDNGDSVGYSEHLITITE